MLATFEPDDLSAAGEKCARGNRHGFPPYLEVQMISCGPPALADGGDRVTPPDELPGSYQVATIVGVDCDELGSMPQDHHTAISARSPVAINHFATRHGSNRRTPGSRDIDAIVAAFTARLEATAHGALYRPDKNRLLAIRNCRVMLRMGRAGGWRTFAPKAGGFGLARAALDHLTLSGCAGDVESLANVEDVDVCQAVDSG